MLRKYSKLLGIKNLFLIILAQYIIRFFLLKPFYAKAGLPLQINEFYFALFVLAGLCIVAAGSLFTAYYDEKVKNFPNTKPETLVLNLLSMTKGYNWALVLDVIGALLGIFVAWSIGFLNLGFLFIIIATILYFYALRYKRLFFWGNFCLSFLSAFSIGIVWLFEFFALKHQPQAFGAFLVDSSLKELTGFVAGYMGLLFFFVYLYQILIQTAKACEDEFAYPYTFASLYGLKNTKILLCILSLVLIVLIVCAQILLFGYSTSPYLLSGVSILFHLPLLFILVKLPKAKDKQDFLVFSNIILVLIIMVILSIVGVQTLL